MTTLTRSVLDRYIAVGNGGIDRAAMDAARVALADGLAVMVAASRLEPAVAPFMAYAAASGSGAATLVGESRKVSPVMAALGNGALAHAIDFEDTFEEGMIHPNASLIPAVLALAESEGSSGQDVMRALVLGCDFACRLALALDGDPALRGWYHPPILAGLGATLGCCLLLKLSADASCNAIGLFAAQFMLADELKRSPLSHLRAVREGLAARAAVEAALLARAGVVAVEQPLEGPSGVFSMLTGNPPAEAAFADIGKTFWGPQVGVKRWPACRGTHSAIIAAQRLRQKGVSPSDVLSVAVAVSPPNDMLFVPRRQRIAPQTPIDAKFSIPFVFATALEHGTVNLASFAPAELRRQTSLDLAGLVHMSDAGPPPGIEAVYAVETASGHTIVEKIEPVPVWRAGGIALEDLSGKLETCLAAGSRPVDVRALLAAIAGIEGDGVDAVMRLL